MTLIVVWPFTDDYLSIASDSRLMLTRERFVDVGVKIVPVDVGFLLPVGADNLRRIEPYATVALATAGGLITTHAVRETVQTAVRSIQREAGRTYGLDDVLRVIAELFEGLARSTCEVLLEKGVAEFAVAGFDLSTRSVRAFHVALDSSDYPVRSTWKQIERNDFPLLLGSGARAARVLLDQEPGLDPLELVRRISADDAVASVGGPVQYSRVGPDGYVTFGVAELEVDDSRQEFRLHNRIAGLEFDSEAFRRKRLPQIGIGGFLSLEDGRISELRDAGYKEIT